MPFIVEIVVWFVLANFIMVLAFSMGYIGIFFFFLMIPLVARAIKATEQRRGAAVIAYLEQAVRLNLPLPPMLKAAQRSERGRLATRLGRLANSLATGVNMAAAVKFAVPELRGAPVAAIASAENLGRLPHTLQRLARHNNARNEIDETETHIIRVYPFIKVISLFFLVTLIMVFVIPKYETIFKDFGVRLPWVTQLMMDFARNFGDLLVFSITTALVIWAIIWAWRIIHPRTARLIVTGFTDRLLWHLPIAHGYARDRGLAEAFDLIADALHAGQPIDHAADEAANLHVNRVLQIRLGYFATWLGSGAALHTAARQSQLPPLVVEMLAPARSGEQVAEVFAFLARYYESRFSRTRLLLRGAAVPLMVLFFAFFVVWVALGMLMPMTDLINAIATPVMQWRI